MCAYPLWRDRGLKNWSQQSRRPKRNTSSTDLKEGEECWKARAPQILRDTPTFPGLAFLAPEGAISDAAIIQMTRVTLIKSGWLASRQNFNFFFFLNSFLVSRIRIWSKSWTWIKRKARRKRRKNWRDSEKTLRKSLKRKNRSRARTSSNLTQS